MRLITQRVTFGLVVETVPVTGKWSVAVSRDMEVASTLYIFCVETCPEVFELGDGFAQVLVDEVSPEHEDAVQQAAEECPVGAIIVEE